MGSIEQTQGGIVNERRKDFRVVGNVGLTNRILHFVDRKLPDRIQRIKEIIRQTPGSFQPIFFFFLKKTLLFFNPLNRELFYQTMLIHSTDDYNSVTRYRIHFWG